jgi:nucleotide-binding universal stress UspA family protein
MSIFPAKIVLATDGSTEAELAARTAADLAQKTHSELHVVHAFGIAPVGPPVYPEATDLRATSKGGARGGGGEGTLMGRHGSWGAPGRGTGSP